MPGFDGTGPFGEGPMTGGGFGYCGTGRRPGYGFRGRPFYGRFGAGRGFGRSFGPYGSPWAVESRTELAELRREADDLKAYLKDVEARIAEVEKRSE
ncbi:MAG: DUF5320 domain-containing protein [Desulfobacterales bacterium]|nr:DUF5320 domain-containing protein [Desulfobacterales bacterium]